MLNVLKVIYCGFIYYIKRKLLSFVECGCFYFLNNYFNND